MLSTLTGFPRPDAAYERWAAGVRRGTDARRARKPATLPGVADPWWASELLRRRGELVSYLEARAGLVSATAREVVDALGAELAERFQRDRKHYPAAWFQEDAPEARAAGAYVELLRTIALRRSYDHLRT